MTAITIQKTKEDAASKSLQVNVPADVVQAAEARALRYYVQKAKLPGFRPGKAPEAVVRKRFSDAIRQAMLEEVIRESWETAKQAESLKPVTDPHIHDLKFEDSGAVVFEFHVEVRPEITLARAGGFALRREAPKVDDAAVAEQLRRIQEQRGNWLPVDGERPKAGELVRVDVATFVHEEFKPATPHTLVLGEGQTLPALEELIMTLLPGETAEGEVRFPDDHAEESLRGQSRRVRVTLHEVKRQQLPALDDALAREVGDFETLDALRAAVRSDLEAAAAREADAKVREKLLEQLVAANEVPAPPTMVNRMLAGLAEAYKIPPEQGEAFAQEFTPIAEAQVRRQLALDAVVRAQNLRATEAEVDARVARLAEARKLTPAQMYTSLEKADRLRDLERSLTEEKAFTWLLEQSTVEEV